MRYVGNLRTSRFSCCHLSELDNLCTFHIQVVGWSSGIAAAHPWTWSETTSLVLVLIVFFYFFFLPNNPITPGAALYPKETEQAMYNKCL